MSVKTSARPKRALQLPPLALDAALALVTLGVTLAMIAHGLGASHIGAHLDLLGALLAAASALPLIAWRRAPAAVFVLTAAAATATAGTGYAFDIPLGATAALYLLAASREQQGWTRALTAAVVALFAIFIGATAAADGGVPWLEVFHTALAWSIAWFAGERTRLLRERMAELRERAEELERSAETERRLAVAEERTRIARDLHDSAGNAINVIAVRAGAARLNQDAEPARSLAALAQIEDVARQTAAELDGIVHSLREDPRIDGPPPTPVCLASIQTLVAHHSQSGLQVAVRKSGDERPLPHAADQAAYRILQEALTNAARHGTGDAAVELAYEAVGLQVTVTNGGGRFTPPDKRTGHGLIGMKERAALAGGNLEAGQIDGRFRVSAWIPYEVRSQCRES